MNKIKEALHLGHEKHAEHKDAQHDANPDGSTVAHSKKTDTELDWKHDPKHGHHTTGVATGGERGDTYTGAGLGSGGAFDARDPVDSGRTVEGTQYNDRTGHTHPTTGSHVPTFEHDPVSAPSGNDIHLRRPSMAPATSSALSVKSGIVGQPGSLSTGLPDRSLEPVRVEPVHEYHGHAHQTFTANLLDPATFKEEHNPTYHTEHVHGESVTHGHPEISTEQYAQEHYDPRQGPDFLGRDVALGGAGVGAAGLAAHELGGHHGSSTSGLGQSSTSEYAAPTGLPSESSHSHHTGRDAGLVAGGLGAGALGASAYAHEQSGPAQRYNQATFGDSHLTGQSGQSVPGPTGSGHNILGSQNNQADSTGRGYQEGPDFVGGLRPGPDQTGVYDKEHFSGGHFHSRANEARDPHTGAAGTLAGEGLTAHEIKEHEKNQAKRDHEGGGLMSHFGSHSKPAEHHDDKMKHKNILTPSTAVSHEGQHHRDGTYADTSKLTNKYEHPSGVAGGDFPSSGHRIDEGEPTALGGHAYPSSTTANVHPNFGAELPTREPHHYYDNSTTGTSDYSKDGNSSFRRSGYAGDGSSSSSYNPMSANYGSSAAIGSTDGYESRQAAAQGLTYSEDPTTGLEGTTAHKSMLHREHPTKLHKEPKNGY